MKHLFSVVLVLLISMFACTKGCAEEILALPEELMYTVTHEKDCYLVCEQFLLHSENLEHTMPLDIEYHESTKSESFSFDDIKIGGTTYKRIHGEYASSSDSLPEYTVMLKYKCPFGEKPEDSEIFINTVRYYDQKYRQIDIGPFARQMDEVGNSVSIHWRDDDTNARIMLTYDNGDVSKGFFPHIEICILRTSNQ